MPPKYLFLLFIPSTSLFATQLMPSHHTMDTPFAGEPPIVWDDESDEDGDIPIDQLDEASDAPLLEGIHGKKLLHLKQLIEKGVNINKAHNNGNTLLHLLIAGNDTVMATALIHSGANIQLTNDQGDTPLHFAVYHNEHDELIRLLLYKGANINAQNKEKNTPLHIAVHKNKFPMVEFLLTHCANPNLPNLYKNVPLHIALAEGFTEVALFLIIHTKSNLYLLDQERNNFLYYVTCYYKEKKHALYLAWLLFQNGVSIHAKNEHGHTPLAIASQHHNQQMFHALKHAFNNAEEQSPHGFRKEHPLHWAVRHQQPHLINVLLAQQHSPINEQNQQKETPLHIAVRNKDVETTRLLLTQKWNNKNDIDVNLQDNQGRNPFELAVASNFDNFFELFEAYCFDQ